MRTKAKPARRIQLHYVVNAIGLSFMLMAVIATLAPLFQKPPPTRQEIEEVAVKIESITPRAVEPLLRSAEGKPTLLIIYASWCPFCRLAMPGLVDRQRAGEFDSYHVLYLSLDYELMAMAKYLARYGFHNNFTPYLVKRTDDESLIGVLQAAGATYDGKIPYEAVFDRNGKMVAELDGVVDKKRLLDLASSLNSKP